MVYPDTPRKQLPQLTIRNFLAGAGDEGLLLGCVPGQHPAVEEPFGCGQQNNISKRKRLRFAQ
jgi:hypothetical protein